MSIDPRNEASRAVASLRLLERSIRPIVKANIQAGAQEAAAFWRPGTKHHDYWRDYDKTVAVLTRHSR